MKERWEKEEEGRIGENFWNEGMMGERRKEGQEKIFGMKEGWEKEEEGRI